MKLSRPATVRDEHGIRWVVSPGDPANKALLTLRKRGYTDMVMTRARIRGRESLPVPTPTAYHARSVRLWECEELLHEQDAAD